MDVNCIVCHDLNSAISIEHIIPESLGNKLYLCQKGKICDRCNQKFSKFEKKALTLSTLVMQRSRYSIPSKKGKPASGEINGLKINGDQNFRKGFVEIRGKVKLIKKQGSTDLYDLIVGTFDRDESTPCTKLFFKIAIEALYHSKIEIYNKYDGQLENLRRFILGLDNKEWPIITSSFGVNEMIDIPEESIINHLKESHIEIKFIETFSSLIFCFKTDEICFQVDLLNRLNSDWIHNILNNDPFARLYPIYYYKVFNRGPRIDKQ
ncbi:HNH endonuclease [Flectobacillus sp. BAB-3569]|uniref:HNH endonuclease n=1 Tax=Flectobacillus sp. BAB-3569 TaxID=1509483 RepID=UPI000BA33F7A|nr:HNH endonuclease [Flectobacillus sp. BAB-3569]PAC28323.1 hypothetical protein BWI92_19630 [Flectobacillus sp. BAB-3569]